MLKEHPFLKIEDLKNNIKYRVCFYDNNGRPITNAYLDKTNIYSLLYRDLYTYETELYKLNPDISELDIFINGLDNNINLEQLFNGYLTFKEINEYFKKRGNLL